MAASAEEARKVLFVDDEPKVLQALERMLRPMRHEWRMTFVDDPCKAVELLAADTFDVIVADMRMPRMTGAELLERARELQPGMARIVLSGQAERQSALRSIAVAHQFLAKPCEAATLRATLARACQLRALLAQAGLADVVGKLGRLPSLPELYRAISAELAKPDASLKSIAAIIARDVAMTAKLLQLVNSAFFGLGQRVTSVEQAVSYLGIDVIRALVLSNAAFTAFEHDDGGYFAALSRHAELTGALAYEIARERDDNAAHGEALLAGMLHHIGTLVLAARLGKRYRDLWADGNGGQLALVERERAELGCDHGRIGAYLLGLWGLSDPIVEAIAHHDLPRESAFREFAPLTAVHAASALIFEQLGANAMALDLDYLDAAGCTSRLDYWRASAERLVANRQEQ